LLPNETRPANHKSTSDSPPSRHPHHGTVMKTFRCSMFRVFLMANVVGGEEIFAKSVMKTSSSMGKGGDDEICRSP